MTADVRVRFAPSPTGLLHLGNARTALLNYIFARQHRGSFILRIEDTDVLRSTDASLQSILEDLRWLGIDWDEGPDRDGPYAPYRQSERLSIYQRYAEQLLAEGRLYKCFCTPERLKELRDTQLSKHTMPRYDGRCRSLNADDIEKMEASGLMPAYRFKVDGKPIVFEDRIHGEVRFDPKDIGDFVVLRSDGKAAYNFACVIDDHTMKISHVIRGEDHLPNTPRQILIYRALGWTPPNFAHHPLILGDDRTPLSKRHGATSISYYREEGFLPEALQCYLVTLGWSPASKKDLLSLEEIIEEFNLDGLSRSAPIHSRKKLEWLNGIFIRKKSDEDLSHALVPYLERSGIDTAKLDRKYLNSIAGLLRDNITLLSQVDRYLGIFFDEKFSYEDKARALLEQPSSRETIRAILNAIERMPEGVCSIQSELTSKLEEETGLKGKKLLAPLRAAITGMTSGPELMRTIPLVGRERIIKRLKMAISLSNP